MSSHRPPTTPVPLADRVLLSIREAALVAGCSETQMRKVYAEGLVRAHPDFTRVRIPRAELNRWARKTIAAPVESDDVILGLVEDVAA